MKTASDFFEKIFRNLFPEKQACEQRAGLFFTMGLLHDAHAVVLNEPGDGDFPGHFQKGEVVLLTPGDDLPRYGGKIAAGIDDDSGASRFFHGGDEPQKPSFCPGLHSGGDGELRSSEAADDGLVLHHMHPAHHAVHAIFPGKKAKLILSSGLFKNFPESNCHERFPPVCTDFSNEEIWSNIF